MSDLNAELQAMHNDQQANLAESLKEINELANKAYEAKTEASTAEEKAKKYKAELTALMETAGVDKITADNCTVSGKMKASTSVPKDLNNKIELFKYLMSLDNNDTISEDIREITARLATAYPTLFSMLTINATSFNSWYNKEQEKQIALGNVDWKLDFLSRYEYYSVGFRKKATKK